MSPEYLKILSHIELPLSSELNTLKRCDLINIEIVITFGLLDLCDPADLVLKYTLIDETSMDWKIEICE
jgi:hypothetical protein